MLPQQQLDQLKGFISVLKMKPDLLHTPELSFFKDYLVSLGANLPDAPKATAGEEKKKTPEPEPMPEEEPEPEPESEESDVELDMEGVIGKCCNCRMPIS